MADAAGRVRVIAGSIRGRRLVVPAGDGVRPTKDIVREAVFSALDARGAIVDAVGARPLRRDRARWRSSRSRGARPGRVLVERDRAALDAIAHNLEHLGLGDRGTGRAGRRRRPSSPARRRREAPFDLVFADPPYDTPDDAVAALARARSRRPGWLAPDAIIAVERPARAEVDPPEGFRACWERTFGDTLVFFVDASDPPT